MGLELPRADAACGTLAPVARDRRGGSEHWAAAHLPPAVRRLAGRRPRGDGARAGGDRRPAACMAGRTGAGRNPCRSGHPAQQCRAVRLKAARTFGAETGGDPGWTGDRGRRHVEPVQRRPAPGCAACRRCVLPRSRSGRRPVRRTTAGGSAEVRQRRLAHPLEHHRSRRSALRADRVDRRRDHGAHQTACARSRCASMSDCARATPPRNAPNSHSRSCEGCEPSIAGSL